ncbi:tRNA (adenosine(37)-N6)-threonylcarbamoyltransferase complex ATPase subunit type 1 TsaE [Paralimibaculum aggregatum]|uniref:tRNA threonylcarbamoyladenosine biosynthesis protein TsaE n=1 Tax=Paralimibaculum aggregatum TaxID=3036245 RepID=A0ABQ6LQF7_9RHOB|nr:tRNA (adenosine(37)-N6)-threonylcarbamoyltransferase complex ATPase subunit type 1 TsaE [Limibaculum sp. NKW23]GMG82911.1 tRNA (adenosine(37)-N6)-threonylcarbamoyltransferase complex ATPase subunit type 1 TsaE [Limibaculum sp. NKW23]
MSLPDPNLAPALHPVRLPDETATAAFGAALAAALRPGDCVTLTGPLGAGKSALARAVIRAALGAPGLEVPSPSYTLVNVYGEGDGPEIWHADLYRLGSAEEALELGLDEALSEAILLIEWPDRMGTALPARRLEITIEVAPDEARLLTLTPVGPGWAAIAAAPEDRP